jgi:pimeloyl-ACP methyl ester carboxylesterase
VPTAVINGITTRYQLTGSGPPLLMFSPGGFSAELANWASLGIYRRLRLLAHLPAACTCITFDRRESGQSGGRVERVSWQDYAAQGIGLLDHLGIAQAHLLGGCAGCSVAIAAAVAYRDRVASMVLYSPAGGARYRLKQQARFASHVSFAAERGLPEVAALAAGSGGTFTTDPRVGPWASVIRADPAFADAYRSQDPARYQAIAAGMGRVLFDRDTVPGAEPEDLLALSQPALIVPGQDDSHATSAARYLAECLPGAQYWDVPVSEQTEQTAPARVTGFLATAATADSQVSQG